MRIGGHHINDPGDYMKEKDSKCEDPIECLKKVILDEKVSVEDVFREIDCQIEKELKEAVAFAEKSPEPEVDEFLRESMVY